MVKTMRDKPGLSQERILAQLSYEYDENMAERVAVAEKIVEENGFPQSTTFLEMHSKPKEAAAMRAAELACMRKGR